jgi:hypothetical protein
MELLKGLGEDAGRGLRFRVKLFVAKGLTGFPQIPLFEMEKMDFRKGKEKKQGEAFLLSIAAKGQRG